MDDYRNDSIHRDRGIGFEGWINSTARNLLLKLGCQGPPVVREYFQPWMNREAPDHGKKGTPSKAILRRYSPTFSESDQIRKAARLASSNFLKVFGPSIRPDCWSAALDHLALEILAPKTWLESCWSTSSTLQAVLDSFPCLSGENLALRLARFWFEDREVAISWFQGGKRIWMCRGGTKSYGTALSELETAAWAGTRDYSRPVIMREPGQEAHGMPFHQGFPKGEVLTLFRNGFLVQTN